MIKETWTEVSNLRYYETVRARDDMERQWGNSMSIFEQYLYPPEKFYGKICSDREYAFLLISIFKYIFMNFLLDQEKKKKRHSVRLDEKNETRC